MRLTQKNVFFLFLCTIGTIIIIIIYVINNEKNILFIKNQKNYKISNLKCKIPKMDPFDESIKKFIFKPKPVICSKLKPLVYSKLNQLFIDQNQFIDYNITDKNLLKCSYKPFELINPKKSEKKYKIQFKNWIEFKSGLKITDEFIKINCFYNRTIIYTDFDNFVPIKNYNKSINENKLNVLLVGFDAVSRLNLIRQLPETRNYLIHNLSAIEMTSYNKVADNTFPNLIPVLTGKTIEELRELCWPKNDAYFDNCHYIWNNYSDQGYLTSFAEDSSWMGIFNYVKNGFSRQPTNYFWEPFNKIMENEIGIKKITFNTKLCVGTRFTHNVFLNYIDKLTLTLKTENYFSFNWGCSISHDILNLPNIADRDYLGFFKNLNKNNILNNTVIIFMSDHGIRWGDIRETPQGQFEERLPFLYLKLPDWFLNKYKKATENIKKNTELLTTPFDLHETLKEFFNLHNLHDTNIIKRTKNEINSRGISLFLPIPDTRDCKTAGISSHWCTCQNFIQLFPETPISSNVSEFIVEHINNLLKNYKQCELLKLNSIIDVKYSESRDFTNGNITLRDYTVILRTSPGYAVFEGTVRVQNNNYTISGSIGRLNLYGMQSYCVNDAVLKLYCYCKK